MSVADTDLEWRLSGGAANVDVDASLGGIMSSAEVVNDALYNLFDPVWLAEATAGDTEYRCIYLVNTHATDTLSNVVAWIDQQSTSPDTDVEIGLDPAGVGDGSTTGVATTIADEGLSPGSVSFSAPSSYGAGLAIGNLGPGDAQAIWVKRNVTAGASLTASDQMRVAVRGIA